MTNPSNNPLKKVGLVYVIQMKQEMLFHLYSLVLYSNCNYISAIQCNCITTNILYLKSWLLTKNSNKDEIIFMAIALS